LNIPEYWAESRIVVKKDGKQATFVRSGWSSINQEDAQKHSEQRLEEAVQAWMSNEEIPRRERRTAYNGAEGVPIREEVIESQERFVITRNSYGALCLNTPDVLIADIDQKESPIMYGCFVMVFLVAFSIWLFATKRFLLGAAAISIAFVIRFLLYWYDQWYQRNRRERSQLAVEAFSQKNPSWGLCLYETPMGFRVIATHSTFDPNSQEVAEFFEQIDADPVYVKMCTRQQCFRARLTAKPWRCGIHDHMVPRSVWPIPKDRLEIREAWVSRYQEAAKGYAACRFLKQLGSSTVDSAVSPALDIHDRLTQCRTGLPIG
jgi:hypothetical protein